MNMRCRRTRNLISVSTAAVRMEKLCCLCSLRFGQPHPQNSVQLVDDLPIWDGLASLILVDNSSLLVDGCGQDLLTHLLRQASLLQRLLEFMGDRGMAEHFAILIEFHCVRADAASGFVGAACKLLVCIDLSARALSGGYGLLTLGSFSGWATLLPDHR